MKNVDFNDYAAKEGIVLTRKHIISSVNNEYNHKNNQHLSPSGFKLLSASSLTSEPQQINWILENRIEQHSLNMLFGEPSSGKSLVGLDWGFCIASGQPWHAHDTKQGGVVIVAGEGFAGYGRRLRALEEKYGRKAPHNLYVSSLPAVLNDHMGAQVVRDAIRNTCDNPLLVIIDTLHRNSGIDENNSRDIGQLIGNIDTYIRQLGCAVLLIHHSGHNQKDRSRGSSAIRAAMDAEFLCSKSENLITLSCCKSKDFEATKPLNFNLEVIPLGVDWVDKKSGQMMTSVCLKEIKGDISKPKSNRLNQQQGAVLQSIYEATHEYGVRPTQDIKDKFGGFDGMFKNKRVVSLESWRQSAYRVIDAEGQEAKKKAFQRIRGKLNDLGFVCSFDDYWWPIQSRGDVGSDGN